MLSSQLIFVAIVQNLLVVCKIGYIKGKCALYLHITLGKYIQLFINIIVDRHIARGPDEK